jgi:hypothetical protein
VIHLYNAGAAGVEVRASGDAYSSATQIVIGAGTITPYGFEVKGDVTTWTRTDGAFGWNTNAAAGTLGSAGMVICVGTAANSWRLLADQTKTY